MDLSCERSNLSFQNQRLKISLSNPKTNPPYPAQAGFSSTSHFEGSIALWAATAALGRNERTQRELAAFDINFGGQRLVQPADCA
jgi:hypothetical protein